MIIRTVVAIAFVAASDASAHGLNLFVRDEGGVVRGNVYFTGGDPAQNLTVTIKDELGNEYGMTTTDAEGNFTYTGARPAATSIFVVSTADGHRAETRLGPPRAAPGTPRIVASAVSMKSYEAELSDIFEAINRLENRLWLRDVIGGIGYIFGLAGLVALWTARSKSPQ